MKRNGLMSSSTPPSSSDRPPVAKKPKLEIDATSHSGYIEANNVDKKKAKKAQRTNQKAFLESLPTFAFNGQNLRERREALGIDDLRTLVMSILLGTPPPGWLVVKNPSNIQHFVVLNIVGLNHELLELPKSVTSSPAYPLALPSTSKHLTSLHKLFSHACPSRAPGELTRLHSALTTFLTTPLSPEEKARRVNERNKQQSQLSKINDPSVFLLTPAEMYANKYVLPSYLRIPDEVALEVDETQWSRTVATRDDSWVETPQRPDINLQDGVPKQKVWGMDCEMIETAMGRELGRISLVDFDTGLTIFDSLVKPSNPVTSYVTQYSGLSEEVLSKAELTLPQLQAKLLGHGMIDSSTILVGHSLENDLAVLKLAHPKVIDTSVIYHHTRGPPAKPGLKWLAQKWLGKVIQAGDNGHDPREDATVCIELLQLKMKNGVNFGRFDHDQEPIFEALGRKDITTAFVGAGANVLGAKATTKVDRDDDVEIMEAVINCIGTHKFVFARLQQLSYALEWCTPFRRNDTDTPPNPPPPLDDTLKTLDTLIHKLHKSLPAYTALCIFTGHSDARKMTEMNKRKVAWDALTRGPSAKTPAEIPRDQWWTAQDGRELEDETERAKKGLVFFCITLPKLSAATTS